MRNDVNFKTPSVLKRFPTNPANVIRNIFVQLIMFDERLLVIRFIEAYYTDIARVVFMPF